MTVYDDRVDEIGDTEVTTYKVQSAKFSGYEVGDTVSADELDPKLNLDALVSSGVLSVEGTKSTKKSAKAEETSEQESMSYGEDRPY